jgi:hypothetical protein
VNEVPNIGCRHGHVPELRELLILPLLIAGQPRFTRRQLQDIRAWLVHRADLRKVPDIPKYNCTLNDRGGEGGLEIALQELNDWTIA